MNALVVLSLAVAAALAEPRPGYLGATTYASGLGIHAVPLTQPASAVLAPAVSSQFHAQDELGQYHYGYSGGPSAKEEIRTADGSVAGAYSYVDAHGIVQSAHYVSDPVNGFRVAATNLPVGPAAPAPAVVAAPAPAVAVAAAPAVVADTPEVAAAKAAHFNAHLAAKAAVLGRKKRSPGFLSTPAATALAAPVAYAAHAYAAPAVAVAPARSFAYSAVAAHGAQVVPAGPVATYAAAAPVVAAAPAVAYSAPAVTYAAPAPVAYSAPAAAAVVPVAASSQYRVQDELGQYSYGYADGNSAKTESRAADGTTVGGYSYVDGNGLVQSVKYHADALGFRVAGTNLPVGPA